MAMTYNIHGELVEIDGLEFIVDWATRRINIFETIPSVLERAKCIWQRIESCVPNNTLELIDMCDWLDDNIQGYYARVGFDDLLFSSEVDALAFKLRWVN